MFYWLLYHQLNIFIAFVFHNTSSCIKTAKSYLLQLVKSPCVLTHCGRVKHICVKKYIIIGSDRWWLVAWSAPNHYLNQCWLIVNWTLGNIPQWNLDRNSYFFIQANTAENVVGQMTAMLYLPDTTLSVRMWLIRIFPCQCVSNWYMIYFYKSDWWGVPLVSFVLTDGGSHGLW